MTPPLVVIAEDEPRLLASLAFIVQREGGRAVGVDNGLAALEAIRRERPVLALLDVMMPGLDGLAVTRAVRAEPELADLPIAVITALGQAEHERQAIAAGATVYIRKPFDVAALRDLIASYLRRA
jgi:two-component system alkaline phosphatase synthesis response regulator PhoP